MKRTPNPVPSTVNNRWFERYNNGGFFCIPRPLLHNVVDMIDNATFYVYIALASCHFEGHTTFAGPYVARLTGKDERAVRAHLKDLETLGLIKRAPHGRGYSVQFECPSRERVKTGALLIAAHKESRQAKRKAAKQDQAGTA